MATVPECASTGRCRTPVPVQYAKLCAAAAEVLAILSAAAMTILSMAAQSLPASAATDAARLALLATIFYLPAARCLGAYDADALFLPRRALARTMSAWAAAILFLALMALLLDSRLAVPASWALGSAVGAAIPLATMRLCLTLCARALRKRGIFDQRSAIFGTGAPAALIASHVAGHEWLTLSLVGFYDEPRPGHHAQCLPVRGGLSELVGAIRAGQVDQVIIALPPTESERVAAAVAALSLTPVRIRQSSEFTQPPSTPHSLVVVGALPMVTITDRPMRERDRIAKGVVDGVLTLGLLMATAPLLLLIALAIRLETPGPIFFRQPREGFNCRPFRIWKFRSMHVDQCSTDNIVQARRSDPRVTRVGAFLRRTSLDELPQLFNVLVGQMSLVGPRPHAVSTRAGDRLFNEIIESYPARHRVKPGITGWAQICGWRGETDTEQKLIRRLDHDLYYIEHWSLLFDFYILGRTATTILRHKAY